MGSGHPITDRPQLRDNEMTRFQGAKHQLVQLPRDLSDVCYRAKVIRLTLFKRILFF